MIKKSVLSPIDKCVCPCILHHCIVSKRRNNFSTYSTANLCSMLHYLQVLEYFHQQKKQRGVDEALLRLYQPIIWRAFKVQIVYYRIDFKSLLNANLK